MICNARCNLRCNISLNMIRNLSQNMNSNIFQNLSHNGVYEKLTQRWRVCREIIIDGKLVIENKHRYQDVEFRVPAHILESKIMTIHD